MEFLRAWTGTQFLLFQHGIQSAIITVEGDCFIDKARNHLATKFLEEFPNVDNFFFLDDDLGWPPIKVLEFLARPQEIVCGIYPKKNDDVSEWPVTLEMDSASRMMIGDPDGGLFSAVVAPTGFMRIKRAALERLAADSPIYMEPAPDGTQERRYGIFECGYDWHSRQLVTLIEKALNATKKEDWMNEARDLLELARRGDWRGEDVDIIVKWRDMGLRVYVDPDIEFTHRGEKVWKGNFIQHFRQWREKFDQEAAAA